MQARCYEKNQIIICSQSVKFAVAAICVRYVRLKLAKIALWSTYSCSVGHCLQKWKFLHIFCFPRVLTSLSITANLTARCLSFIWQELLFIEAQLHTLVTILLISWTRRYVPIYGAQSISVCSLQSGEWYRFDDEHVSKLDKKYLGEEEDEAMLGQSWSPLDAVLTMCWCRLVC